MSRQPSTILVVEHHGPTLEFLADNLTCDGYRVLPAPDQAKALAVLSTARPDLMLGDVNGQTLGLLEAIRSGEGIAGPVDPDVPVIVLSAVADRLQRIRLLERGGDDVVRKPFSYPELRARVAAVLRRREAGRRAPVLRAGPVSVDVRARDVRVHGRPVRLTAKEYALLVALAGEPTRVFSRRELLRTVWGTDGLGESRTLSSHAHRLRRKLRDGSDERLVVNVFGVGYKLLDAEPGR
jgi:DNA-binding response OmpR family regulator